MRFTRFFALLLAGLMLFSCGLRRVGLCVVVLAEGLANPA